MNQRVFWRKRLRFERVKGGNINHICSVHICTVEPECWPVKKANVVRPVTDSRFAYIGERSEWFQIFQIYNEQGVQLFQTLNERKIYPKIFARALIGKHWVLTDDQGVIPHATPVHRLSWIVWPNRRRHEANLHRCVRPHLMKGRLIRGRRNVNDAAAVHAENHPAMF